LDNITESPSNYDNLENLSVSAILHHINQEDKTVPMAVEKAIPAIEKLVGAIVDRMQNGGRLFYIGAGTSGRLGIVDASECPPTFGVPNDLVVAVIAGGDVAIREAVEFAEDDERQAWEDLQAYGINSKDILIGIAASGKTPYVLGGVKMAKQQGLLTACITSNKHTGLAAIVDHPIEVIVGPEFVTGSTRMKAGTAQKLVLNMISTSVMIKLGRVKGNQMVDMQLSNNKLLERGTRMLMKELSIGKDQAEKLLQKYGSVRNAIEKLKKK
jgi:N-acetylmuramic acid 6-phosphate etherase